MRLLRSQTARWRSRPAGIVDLPCCYILLRGKSRPHGCCRLFRINPGAYQRTLERCGRLAGA